MNIRRSLGINGITQATTFLLSLGSAAIVSRLLTPDEIGIFSVSAALIGFAHIARDFGVGQYLIQARQVDRQQMRAAFTVMLATSWILAGMVYLAREPIAGFYGRRGVAEVLGLISANFLIIPFCAPILSMLNREMQFGKISAVTLSNNIVQHSVTVGAALAGLSYMSLAWGSLAGMVANVIVLTIFRPKDALLMPTSRGLKDVLTFGYKSTANSLLTELSNSSPDLIFGRTLGFSAVAYFSRALSIVNLATGQILRLVQSVLLPAFAAQIRAGLKPADLYARAISYVTGVTVPALGFVGLMAAPIITLMFGPQWTRSATLASMFCLSGMIGAPFFLMGAALVANGQVGVHLRLQAIVQCVRVPVLFTSIWLTLEQTAITLILASILLFYPMYASTLRKAFGLSFKSLWAEVRSSYLVAPIALVAPAGLRILDVTHGWNVPDIVLLATGGALFSAGWVGAVFVTHHPIRSELITLLTRVASRIPKAGSCS